MEAVEQQRQFVFVNGRAGIFDGHARLAAIQLQPQGKSAAVGAEFNGVVDQIINDLRDAVALRPCPDRLARQIDTHIEMLVVDFLLEGNQHITQFLAEIEARLPALLHAHGLKLCDIKHIAHQP